MSGGHIHILSKKAEVTERYINNENKVMKTVQTQGAFCQLFLILISQWETAATLNIHLIYTW